MRKDHVVAEMLTIQVFQKHSLQVFFGIADKSQCDGFWYHVNHFTLNHVRLSGLYRISNNFQDTGLP